MSLTPTRSAAKAAPPSAPASSTPASTAASVLARLHEPIEAASNALLKLGVRDHVERIALITRVERLSWLMNRLGSAAPELLADPALAAAIANVDAALPTEDGDRIARAVAACLRAFDDADRVAYARALSQPPPAPSQIRELLVDLRFVDPPNRGAGEAMVANALDTLERRTPEPITRALVQILRTRLLESRFDDSTSRVRHALAEVITFGNADGGAFGPPPSSLRPASARHDAIVPYPGDPIRTLADAIGRSYPAPFNDRPFVDERDDARRQHAEAVTYHVGLAERSRASARPAVAGYAGTGETLAQRRDRRGPLQADPGMAIAQVEREADEWLHERETEIGARHNAAHREWLRKVDDVRLAVLASIDRARLTAKSPLVVFGLDELARYGRSMPLLITAGQALELVLGRVAFVDFAGGAA